MKFIWEKPDFGESFSKLRIDEALALLIRCEPRIVDLDRGKRLILPTDFCAATQICEEKTWKMWYCPADYLRLAPETLWRAYFYREVDSELTALGIDTEKLGTQALKRTEARPLIDTILSTATNATIDRRGRSEERRVGK